MYKGKGAENGFLRNAERKKRKEKNGIGNEEQVACADFLGILADGGRPVYLYHLDPPTARTPFSDPGLSLISGMTARDRDRMARELELRITNPQRWKKTRDPHWYSWKH